MSQHKKDKWDYDGSIGKALKPSSELANKLIHVFTEEMREKHVSNMDDAELLILSIVAMAKFTSSCIASLDMMFYEASNCQADYHHIYKLFTGIYETTIKHTTENIEEKRKKWRENITIQ